MIGLQQWSPDGKDLLGVWLRPDESSPAVSAYATRNALEIKRGETVVGGQHLRDWGWSEFCHFLAGKTPVSVWWEADPHVKEGMSAQDYLDETLAELRKLRARPNTSLSERSS